MSSLAQIEALARANREEILRLAAKVDNTVELTDRTIESSLFQTTNDLPFQVFNLSTNKTVFQVINNGAAITDSEWSQDGISITVTPENGGILSDGYIIILQQ